VVPLAEDAEDDPWADIDLTDEDLTGIAPAHVTPPKAFLGRKP
jgi:hypothetical protein